MLSHTHTLEWLFNAVAFKPFFCSLLHAMDSDGSYSDLTDLESDEYKEKPKKKSTGNVPKNGGYRIKNALKVPRATTYTAQALYGER